MGHQMRFNKRQGWEKPPADQSLPIKSSPIRRFLLLRVLDVFGDWLPVLGGVVQLIAPGLVVKCGTTRRLAEAHTMDFIAKNTSVPVPRVVTAFESKKSGIRYIVMTRLAGVPLDTVWDEMSEESRNDIMRQLRGYMDQIRALKPPTPGYIGSVDQTPLADDRIFHGTFGPFSSVEEFHRIARAGVTDPTTRPEMDNLQKLIDDHSRTESTVCLTHGDLDFRNIMIKDGRITGIMDWELAGWLPYYWEYTNAWFSFGYTPDWRPLIDGFLDPYPQELEMEKLRRKLFYYINTGSNENWARCRALEQSLLFLISLRPLSLLVSGFELQPLL